VATYLATPEEAFREAIELSRSANDPRWTIYQMSLADLCVQPGQKAVDFAEYQKRIAPLVEAAATPGDCNPVSTPDFLRMVGYVRQMPRSESLAWINETLTKFGPHANDGLERHRLMLEAYRAHLEFESAVLDGTARTADDWNAMLERTEALLRRIDALPDGPEKELLQFVARSAHGPMLCHSAVAHQGTPEFRRRLIEGTRELADAVAALEDGFSGRMHDGNLDYVTRFLFARYTRILLTSNEPIADREFNERRAKAIDALKPLAARTNLSSAHRSDVERLISGLNSIPPKQARPMSSANRDG